MTLTRPDLVYAVQQVCLFMDDPREPHFALVKLILRYVKGTLSSSLQIGTDPVATLTAYSDADWAGCLDSRHSTSGYCVYLRLNIGRLHMWSQNVAGFVSCSRSFVIPSQRLRSYIVTMSVQSI